MKWHLWTHDLLFDLACVGAVGSALLLVILIGIRKYNSPKTTQVTEVKFVYLDRINELEEKVKILEQRVNEINNITVKSTAYNAVPEQTDNEPDVNACRQYPRIGRIAVSQDLFYKGWTCGKWIAVQGEGIFQIDDVMHNRKTNQVDIIKETIPEAEKFGVKENLNAVLLTHYEKLHNS